VQHTDVANVYVGDLVSIRVDLVYGWPGWHFITIIFGDNSPSDHGPEDGSWPYTTSHVYTYPGSFTLWPDVWKTWWNSREWDNNWIIVNVQGNSK
jgi:hypothetical protein